MEEIGGAVDFFLGRVPADAETDGSAGFSWGEVDGRQGRGDGGGATVGGPVGCGAYLGRFAEEFVAGDTRKGNGQGVWKTFRVSGVDLQAVAKLVEEVCLQAVA